MVGTETNLPVKTEGHARVEKRRQLSPAAGLRTEIDRFFNDFDREFWGFPRARSLFDVEGLFPQRAIRELSPAIDVVENDKHYQITAELPGIDEKDVEVKVSNGQLTITGKKDEENKESDKGYYLSERRYGAFLRCIQLPDGVDVDKIEANIKKGVLTVTVPKTAEALKAEKKIAIKSA
jgi:HSP20 family protein